MQLHEFESGGFVAHRVMLVDVASRFSIWVNALGILTDAERIDARGRSYPVKRDSAVWARLDGRAQVICATQSRITGAAFYGTITTGF